MNDEKHMKYVPEYGNDALSEVLCLLELNVNIYHNAKVCGDWRITEHNLGATCFHIVTHGSCRLYIPDLYDGVLKCGDLVIFPKELAHSIQPETPLVGKQQHLTFQESTDIDGTGILCGEVHFQHKGCQYLFDSLPPLFVIKCSDTDTWLQPLLNMIVNENHNIGIGSRVIFDKLSELLFTYALKQYLLDNPNKIGVLSLYVHPRIAKAVSAIHKYPERNWTIESMAKEAMLSRTSFTETFKAISGWTAGQYLTWWRMQLAWSFLKRGRNITQVSSQVGYHSESSFSRAFQKQFNISAGKIRSESRHRSGSNP